MENMVAPDLEERMDHGGVPLHADGDCEVDGARQAYLGQRQQHRHEVGVPRLVPDAVRLILIVKCILVAFICLRQDNNN